MDLEKVLRTQTWSTWVIQPFYICVIKQKGYLIPHFWSVVFDRFLSSVFAKQQNICASHKYATEKILTNQKSSNYENNEQ
jgi:hypothetical protein